MSMELLHRADVSYGLALEGSTALTMNLLERHIIKGT